jgi:HNH endonuclease
MGRVCIYCVRSLPDSSFNREHVLLKALGGFRKNLIIRCVCSECNDYFGRTIDRVFARGSLEALLRLELGLKPTEEVTNLLTDRLTFQYPAGSYEGLWLEPIPDNGRVVLRPQPQVGFMTRAGDSWLYVRERELQQLTNLPQTADPAGRKRVLAQTQEGYERLLGHLRRLGVEFRPDGAPPVPEGWGEVEPEVTAVVDNTIQRCVAKMAFNYLAYTMGPDFALRVDFHPVRGFVREGTHQPHPVVTESQTPILADDELARRQTRGHLITLQWDDRVDELISLVSPFNEITYRVVLCRGFSGVWRPIRYGHCYDLSSRTILPLFGTQLPLVRFRTP